MNRWRFMVVLAALVTAGCGGGKGVSENLSTLRVGDKWVYKFTGSVEQTGSGTQTAKPEKSTVTIEVVATAAKDLNDTALIAIDRTYKVELLDGSTVTAVQRLFVTQAAAGVLVHGMNNTDAPPLVDANAKFVPATASPKFAFLYLPSPLLDNSVVTFTDPFLLGGTTKGHHVAVGAGWTVVTVPAGTFQAKGIEIEEGYSGLSLTNTAYSPQAGILFGLIKATVGKDTFTGSIVLQSRATGAPA